MPVPEDELLRRALGFILNFQAMDAAERTPEDRAKYSLARTMLSVVEGEALATYMLKLNSGQYDRFIKFVKMPGHPDDPGSREAFILNAVGEHSPLRVEIKKQFALRGISTSSFDSLSIHRYASLVESIIKRLPAASLERPVYLELLRILRHTEAHSLGRLRKDLETQAKEAVKLMSSLSEGSPKNGYIRFSLTNMGSGVEHHSSWGSMLDRSYPRKDFVVPIERLKSSSFWRAIYDPSQDIDGLYKHLEKQCKISSGKFVKSNLRLNSDLVLPISLNWHSINLHFSKSDSPVVNPDSLLSRVQTLDNCHVRTIHESVRFFLMQKIGRDGYKEFRKRFKEQLSIDYSDVLESNELLSDLMKQSITRANLRSKAFRASLNHEAWARCKLKLLQYIREGAGDERIKNFAFYLLGQRTESERKWAQESHWRDWGNIYTFREHIEYARPREQVKAIMFVLEHIDPSAIDGIELPPVTPLAPAPAVRGTPSGRGRGGRGRGRGGLRGRGMRGGAARPIVVVDLLRTAIADGNIKAVRELMNEPERDTSAALHMAVQAGDPLMVREVLKSPGSDSNLRNAAGESPLDVAALSGNVPVMRELLKDPKILVNSQNAEGRSALHLAAMRGQTEAVRALLSAKGIDCNLKEVHDKSPLDLAEEGEHWLAGYLLSRQRQMTGYKMNTLLQFVGQNVEGMEEYIGETGGDPAFGALFFTRLIRSLLADRGISIEQRLALENLQEALELAPKLVVSEHMDLALRASIIHNLKSQFAGVRGCVKLAFVNTAPVDVEGRHNLQKEYYIPAEVLRGSRFWRRLASVCGDQEVSEIEAVFKKFHIEAPEVIAEMPQDLIIPVTNYTHAMGIFFPKVTGRDLTDASDELTRTQGIGNCWLRSTYDIMRRLLIRDLGMAGYKETVARLKGIALAEVDTSLSEKERAEESTRKELRVAQAQVARAEARAERARMAEEPGNAKILEVFERIAAVDEARVLSSLNAAIPADGRTIFRSAENFRKWLADAGELRTPLKRQILKAIEPQPKPRITI